MNNFLIYLIINFENTKLYVGKTNDFKRRKSEHWAYKGYKTMPIDRSIKKYGNGKFRMIIIELCDSKEEMNEAEEFWILYYKSMNVKLYNLGTGGEYSPMLGREHTEDTKEKIRVKATGRLHSEETKIKIGMAGLGRVHSEESKTKMSIAQTGDKNHSFGKKQTAEHIAKCIAANNIPIIAINKNNDELPFESAKYAGIKLNIDPSSITKCLKGKVKTAKGYIFKYKN